MPYDVLERKVQSLPLEAQTEIFHYVDYIYSIYFSGNKKDTSFIDDMCGLLSHEEAEELREHAHLKFKEL